MFEDLIKPKKTGHIHWDWDKYKKVPYCPTCGSKDTVIIRDLLKDKKLTNTRKCKNCSTEWKEVYNENLDLELVQWGTGGIGIEDEKKC
jgi:transcription elongation factor Elf1